MNAAAEPANAKLRTPLVGMRMDKIERLFLVLMLVALAITAISWIGPEYFALLAMFEMAIGVLIGMVIFLPNRNKLMGWHYVVLIAPLMDYRYIRRVRKTAGGAMYVHFTDDKIWFLAPGGKTDSGYLWIPLTW